MHTTCVYSSGTRHWRSRIQAFPSCLVGVGTVLKTGRYSQRVQIRSSRVLVDHFLGEKVEGDEPLGRVHSGHHCRGYHMVLPTNILLPFRIGYDTEPWKSEYGGFSLWSTSNYVHWVSLASDPTSSSLVSLPKATLKTITPHHPFLRYNQRSRRVRPSFNLFFS